MSTMRAFRDERGVILSWFAKVLAGFAVASLILFDLGAIAVNYVGLDSTADDIVNTLARDMSAEAAPSTSPQALEEARRLARDSGARLLTFRIDPEGLIHLKIRRSARTVLAGRVEALRDYTRATVSARTSIE
jgi:hypothetical protein